jgi:O-antigen/teichoic acid export membrane protein
MLSRSRPRRPERGPRANATAWVVFGSGVAGLAAYAFQILGTRALGAVDYAPIGVLWTLQYLLLGIALTAIEAFVTRTVNVLGPGAAETRRVQRVLVAWLVAAAAVAGATAYLLREQLFAGLGDLALVLAFLVLSYGSYTIARGRAAGVGRFRAYGLATLGESTIRLIAAAAVLSVVTSARALAWIFPVGPAIVSLWALGNRRHRGAEPEHDPAARPIGSSPTRFLVSTVAANASVQLLLAAGPLALVALQASAREISVFFTTITLTRAPMTFVLNGGLSRALPPLIRMATDEAGRGLRAPALLTASATLGTAAVAGAVTWPLGPAIVELLFGADFRPDPYLVTVATATAVMAVGGLAFNQFFIALGRETELPKHWSLGLLVATVLVLALPLEPSERVITAFAAGMAMPLATMTIWAYRSTTLRAR